jgi:hypothetical protein
MTKRERDIERNSAPFSTFSHHKIIEPTTDDIFVAIQHHDASPSSYSNITKTLNK